MFRFGAAATPTYSTITQQSLETSGCIWLRNFAKPRHKRRGSLLARKRDSLIVTHLVPDTGVGAHKIMARLTEHEIHLAA
jgi:hypothetical protein